nr:immunoglobulin light chain junction region [Macaca mulatta]MOW36367.1 immunoglobulin light chain junction region [Macaca mulatta]MOW36488.1 immunoglobulin light chain junction region [Macaca mulatta]MOW36631.1 immunoglobulin light chain junction region [Macaca mulatta]MOW36923.1 immunoglobulin light chain junction region [Macaca mulatta]
DYYCMIWHNNVYIF